MTVTLTIPMIARHVSLVLALLVLAGCSNYNRLQAYQGCISRCSGADCIERCGASVAKAFGADKEAEHVFRWDKGRDK